MTVNCVIPQKYHRIIMGPKGSKVQSITEEFGVQIKFPDRVDPEAAVSNGVNNNNNDAAADKPAVEEEDGEAEPVVAVESAITITGDLNLGFTYNDDNNNNNKYNNHN